MKDKSQLQENKQKIINRLCDLSVVLYAISLSLGITWQWVIFLIGLGLYILSIVCGSNPKQQLKDTFKSIAEAPLTIPLIIFVLAVTLSGLANGGLTEGLRSFTSFRGILIYFWAYQAFTNRVDLREKATITAIVVGCCSRRLGMIQQITGYHPHTFAYLQGTGFLAGPMAFAGIMQILSLLAFGLTINNAYKNLHSPLAKPSLFYLVLAGNACGLIFSGERSAWVGGNCCLVCLIRLTVLAQSAKNSFGFY